MSEDKNSVIYAKNPYIVPRTIHGSFFLINIGDNYAGDRCALHEVNQTGMFLWNQLDGKRTSKNVAELLKNAIVADIDESVIVRDTEEFLRSLEKLAFVEVISRG